MKKYLFILLSIHLCGLQFAQIDRGFKALRYDENYTYLKNDTTPGAYKNAKYIALSKINSSFISFGGDIRYQYFNFMNENWGQTPRDKDGYVLSRFLVHADIHLGKNFRSFVQLQSSLANGKSITSPLDENPMELHQAFFDIGLDLQKGSKLTFRAGRQEFAYGSQRLVAVRDGPNNRLSFDAIKGIFSSGNLRADLFYSYPVPAKKDLFNDKYNTGNKFWGVYIVKNKIPLFHNLDLYYLGLKKERVKYDDGEGREIRHTIGGRLWANKNKMRYDIEGLFQFGQFIEKSISAWSVSFNVGYKADIKFKPEAGLKTELISGDARYNDGKLQTLNPLFPKGGYFGLASLIGPSNLFDIHPSLAFQLHRSLSLDFDYDWFWRYSRNDGIYTPGVSIIYSGKNNPYLFIGKQLSTTFTYSPNSFFNLRAEFTWFDSGAFLKFAGPSKDIFFVGITGQLKL